MPWRMRDIAPVILFILGGWCIWHLFLGMPVTIDASKAVTENIAVAEVAFAAAILIALGLLFSVNSLTKGSGGEDKDHSFWEIIYSEDCNPSLSLFQFFAWTIVIVIAFLAISLIRMKGGEPLPPADTFPAVLLALMGVAVVTPIVSGSTGFSFSYAEEKPDSPGEPPVKTCDRAAFKEMLFLYKPTHKLSLTRFQLFCWTFIGILIYIVNIGTTLAETAVSQLNLPNVDPIILGLMGLSSLSYLGGKYLTTQAAEKEKEKETPAAASAAPVPAQPGDAVQPVRTAIPEAPPVAIPREVSAYRGVSDQVRDFILVDHKGDIREKLKAGIEAANSAQLIRYFLVGKDFYYLIENGQLVASSSKGIDRDGVLKAVENEQKTRGKAEIIYVA